MLHRSLTALCFFGSVIGAYAQLPTLDITMVPVGGNQLEVKVRPDANFDGLFSSLVFTIRWETSSGATLSSVGQPAPVGDYIPIGSPGGTVDDGGYRYKSYTGFGFNTLVDAGTSWAAGTEYTLITLQVQNGTSTFEIIEDAYTAATNNNYYVSLNGADRTGIIYSPSTGVTAGEPAKNEVSILPNPSEGAVQLLFGVEDTQDLQIDVVNSLGQSVYSERLAFFQGIYRRELDLKAQGSGVYMVNITGKDGLRTHRVVIR
ncbi:MAG: T9SS type A sorting domain-containing protein [Flavobacteriales bacterium]|nr:T9SS type A sorting domain-containing protein [Flavobacteriales bacterium]